MAWSHLEDEAPDHPKLIKVARYLKEDPVKSFGHVVSLWCWTTRMAPDGILSSYDVEDIEIGARWDGEEGAFVAACVRAGLLDEIDHPKGYEVHGYWKRAGSHKKSLQKRKERMAKANEEQVSRDKDATVAPLSRDMPEMSHTREREREMNEMREGTKHGPTKIEPYSLNQDKAAKEEQPRKWTNEVLRVFDRWCSHRGQFRTPTFSCREWGMIEALLNAGVTVETILLAVDGAQIATDKQPRARDLSSVVREEGWCHTYAERAPKPKPAPEPSSHRRLQSFGITYDIGHCDDPAAMLELGSVADFEEAMSLATDAGNISWPIVAERVRNANHPTA